MLRHSWILMVVFGLGNRASAEEQTVPDDQKKRAAPFELRLERDGMTFLVEGEGAVRAGTMSGLGVRTRETALAELELDLEPQAILGPVDIVVPIDFERRETFGADLNETRAGMGLDVGYKPARWVQVTAGGAVKKVWRPEWPDLYQPDPNGQGLLRTDRYTYGRTDIAAGARFKAAQRQWVRLNVGYSATNYEDDPNFDPANEPTHLVPADHTKKELGGSWAGRFGGARLEAGADVFWRSEEEAYARDAGTGRTHAGPGGAPPNPLQETRGIEPRGEIAFDLLAKRLRLALEYSYEAVEDRFQGYYSYRAHNPELSIRFDPIPALRFDLDVDAHLRRYGPNSYAEGPSHPALEDGNRRYEHRYTVDVDARIRMSQQLSAVVEARYRVRDTNFPDYVPNVFPATRQYSIDWDYTNWRILGGFAFEM